MNYQKNIYRLTAKTNMHVGSGEQNYGIIDNLVQRDVISNYPVINGSSLKGALREYFAQKNGATSDLVNYIFGTENTDSNQNKAGNFRFFDAHLLSIPIRSNTKPYFNVSSPLALEQYRTFRTQFGMTNNLEVITCGENEARHFDNSPNSILEDVDIQTQKYQGASSEVQQLIGTDAAIAGNTIFKRLTDNNHLPVIARNSLVNGISENLWYEQIVPRETTFYFFIMHPDTEKGNEFFSVFDTELTQSDTLVQIGANASIGYGFSSIKKISAS